MRTKETYPAKPVIDLETLAEVYGVIIYNCGGTLARNGRRFYVHDCDAPSVFIEHLATATPLCYEYTTYFNARDNNVFKLTYPPTGEQIIIEFIAH